jgi:hypothetical protein
MNAMKPEITEIVIGPESPIGLSINTRLMICGENLDSDAIAKKLNLSPKIARLYSRLVQYGVGSSIVDGASRNYDSRLDKGYWTLLLTNKQYKFDLSQQLEFWIEKLYPVRSSFEEFKELGYWCVIDCQVASGDPQLPSSQFRFPGELHLKLSKLFIDIDFTIFH